jgi:hypothetical protein
MRGTQPAVWRQGCFQWLAISLCLIPTYHRNHFPFFYLSYNHTSLWSLLCESTAYARVRVAFLFVKLLFGRSWTLDTTFALEDR